MNIGRYCKWAFEQVGPEPLYPFGRTVRHELEPPGRWSSYITINYSSVSKVFSSMNETEIQRSVNLM